MLFAIYNSVKFILSKETSEIRRTRIDRCSWKMVSYIFDLTFYRGLANKPKLEPRDEDMPAMS